MDTGYGDKNLRKMHEGDTVKIKDDDMLGTFTGVVAYRNGRPALVLDSGDWVALSGIYPKDIEVIYDNA